MKKFFSKEVIIGISVLVSIFLLLAGIEFLKGVNVFKSSNSYIAKYNNVTGLAVSAPVTINGFQVGLVGSIDYDYTQTGVVIVELNLNDEIQIPVGSKAQIVCDMLGVASVNLVFSDNKEICKQGSELEGEYVSGLMGELSEKLMPGISSIIPKLDSIVSNINAITANPALNAAITRLDKISANLEQTTTALNKMATNQLPNTLENVSVISDNLNVISTDFKQVSASIKNMPLDSTLNNLNNTVANLSHVTNQLKGTDSSIGLLLNDRGLYDHINTTIFNVDSLLIDLRHNPKKYVNFKLF